MLCFRLDGDLSRSFTLLLLLLLTPFAATAAAGGCDVAVGAGAAHRTSLSVHVATK